MDFNMNQEGSMEQVQSLAEEAIHNSRVPFLGLLCGDMSPQVVWKMMYLSQHLQSVEERCTLLNILTDYIVNTPSLLEEDSKIYKLHSPRNMIQTLSDCWSILLPQAVDALSDESFVNFKGTLINSSLTLEKYSLHHDLDSVVIPQQNDDDTFPVQSRRPVFPNNASIPLRKLKKIRSTRNDRSSTSSSATAQKTSTTTSTTARPASSTASATFTRPASATNRPAPVTFARPASAKPAASATSARPASVTSARPASVTSARPASVTSAGPASATSARPASVTSARPASVTSAKPAAFVTFARPATVTTVRPASVTAARPASVTSPRPASVTSARPAFTERHVSTSTAKQLPSMNTTQPQSPRTPTSIAKSTLVATTSNARSVSPSARRLILAELERLHLVRSSPAMPIFSRSPKTSDTSTVKPTATEQNVDDLRKSVHSKSMKSSLHPKTASVTRELYFNPQ